MGASNAGRFNWLAGGAVAALLVPAFVLGLGVPFLLAGAIAMLAGAGAGLVLARRSALESLDVSTIGRARLELVRDLLLEAEPIVTRLEAASATIRLPGTAERVRHMAATANGILEGIARDPLKLERVRRFVTYYLPRAAEMAEAFSLVESTQRPDSARLAETAALLERLDQAFAGYAGSLVDADLQRIDIEMKLLKASLDDDLAATGRRDTAASAVPNSGKL